jgi:hypothetical protein
MGYASASAKNRKSKPAESSSRASSCQYSSVAKPAGLLRSCGHALLMKLGVNSSNAPRISCFPMRASLLAGLSYARKAEPKTAGIRSQDGFFA